MWYSFMHSVLRLPWFRRMVTFMVIIGIWLASDGWIAHLASCIQPTNRQLAETCKQTPPGGDCLVAPRVESAHLAVCLEPDGCGCCAHEGSTHLSEVDGRIFSTSDPDHWDGLLVTTTAIILRDEPFVPGRAVPTTDRPLPAARIFLLLGHLLF